MEAWRKVKYSELSLCLVEIISVCKKSPIKLNLKIAMRFEDSHDCSNGETITTAVYTG